MKHRVTGKRTLVMLTAFILLLSLTACTTSGPTNTEGASTVAPSAEATTSTGSAAEETAAAPETAAPAGNVVELSILVQGTGSTLENYISSRTQQAMAAATGVQYKLVQADVDKINVLLAGGDLPDIVRISTAKFNQLIGGKQVIALDDLLASNGKDILVTVPDTLAFSKKYWSDGQDKTYFVPVQVGADGVGLECWMSGVRIRWDYYKELGYPAIKSMDDFLNVLKQMVDKHPTTDDGKPVYGVSSFSDWGSWNLQYPMNSILGFYQINNSKTELLKVDTNQVTNMTLDENASFWKAVEFMYKANQMGILDPDALTQKNADLAAKATAGQILSGVFGGDFNTNNNKDLKGFVNLPVEFGYSWGNAMNLAGWPDKCFGITTNCRAPEKAMDWLNYLYSYDGSRTLYNGIKGTDWDIKDGVPTITDDTMALRQAGGDPWLATGIGFDQNLMGLSPYTRNPSDGKPLSLFQESSVYAKQLDPLQKDYCDHYSVSYPQEALDKLVQAGKTHDQSGENTLATALLPVPDDDMARIEAKLDDLMIKSSAKLIMAKSDSEFDTIKQQTLADFKAAGAETLAEYWSKAWNTAVEQAKAIQ